MQFKVSLQVQDLLLVFDINKNVDELISLPEIKQAYHNKIKSVHPDRGGDARQFILCRKNYRYLMIWWDGCLNADGTYQLNFSSDDEPDGHNDLWTEVSSAFDDYEEALKKIEEDILRFRDEVSWLWRDEEETASSLCCGGVFHSQETVSSSCFFSSPTSHRLTAFCPEAIEPPSSPYDEKMKRR